MIRYLSLIALAAALALPGCGKKEESAPAAPKTPQAGGMMDTMKNAVASIDTSKYTAALTAVESQVGKLKDMAQDKTDAELNKLIDLAGEKMAAAQKKLASLKDAGGGTAEALKKEMDALMPELQKLIDQAMAKAKELGAAM